MRRVHRKTESWPLLRCSECGVGFLAREGAVTCGSPCRQRRYRRLKREAAALPVSVVKTKRSGCSVEGCTNRRARGLGKPFCEEHWMQTPEVVKRREYDRTPEGKRELRARLNELRAKRDAA
jgi:hypothetical protein